MKKGSCGDDRYTVVFAVVGIKVVRIIVPYAIGDPPFIKIRGAAVFDKPGPYYAVTQVGPVVSLLDADIPVKSISEHGCTNSKKNKPDDFPGHRPVYIR